MIIVGISASSTIIPICPPERGVTENTLSSTGTNSTSARRQTPATKAPRLYQFLLNPRRKMDLSLRQLNPWNSRAIVSVAKAMVLAIAAPPFSSPIWKAIMVQTAIRPPCSSRSRIKSFVRIPCLGSLGGWERRFRSAGSIPMASAGRESVSRLMNSRCTGAKGTGRAASDV